MVLRRLNLAGFGHSGVALVTYEGDLIHRSRHGQQYLNEGFFMVGHCFLRAPGVASASLF